MDLASITSFATSISLDWIFLFGVGALAFVDSLRAGSARTVALALSFPSAYLLLGWVADAQFMGDISKQFSSSLAQGLFAALIVVLCFLLFYRITDGFTENGGIQAVAGAIGLVIMLALFWQLIPAFTSLHTMAPQLKAIFSVSYRLWWFLVALVALAFSRS